MGSHDVGSQLLLGIGVAADEQRVPYTDPLVHKPYSGVVLPFETALCYREGLPHLVDEGSQMESDDLMDTQRAPCGCLVRRCGHHAVHGQASDALWDTTSSGATLVLRCSRLL